MADIRGGAAARIPGKAARYLRQRRARRDQAGSPADEASLLYAAVTRLVAAGSTCPPWRRPLTADLSEQLQAFTRAEPYIREGILGFVREVAAAQPPGAQVLDIGAGEAPYRELFEHVEYLTTDWEQSVHPGAAYADAIAPADNLPFADASFDAVLMTEVLEHVADPVSVLSEAHRVIRAGGHLYLTVPFVWPLHEMPHDHYRYTPSSLTRLVELGGFAEPVVAAHGNYFLTIGQLLWDAPGLIAAAEDRRNELRQTVGKDIQSLSAVLARLADLDGAPTLPLGFTVIARRGA